MNLRAKYVKRSLRDYKRILEIYNSSFTDIERYPVLILRLASHFKRINFIAFYDGNDPCGLTYYCFNEKSVYILYLAVEERKRSKGYGSRILAWIKKKHPDKEIFLNVEKPEEYHKNYLQQIRRIEFYRRNGIFSTNHNLTFEGVTYTVLCTDSNFSEEYCMNSYIRFIRFFKKKKR